MLGVGARALSPSSRGRFLSRFSTYDVAWAALSPTLAFIIRHGGFDHVDAMLIYCGTAFVTSVITFQLFKISQPMSRFFSVADAEEVTKACLVSVAVAGALLFTLTRMDETPRAVPLIHFFILITGLIAGRCISRIRHRRREALKSKSTLQTVENIVIVGVSRLAWFYSKLIEEFADGESRVIAILDDQSKLQNRSLNGYLIAGPPSHASNIVEEYAAHGVEVHKIVVAVSPESLSAEAWGEIKLICRQRRIALEVLPERLSLSPSSKTSAQTHPAQHEDPSSPGRGYAAVKRAVDILFAVAILPVVSPLAVIVALVVLIDVGYPVVFWQERLGRFGRLLHIYKFRTMRAPFDRTGCPVRDSERLSQVGRFLRATRLDEIPQLWNILIGEMSVVGPRPLLPIDQPPDSTRLDVRPGLTGLAQISGGKLLSIEEKNAFDEHYVQHASIFLDFGILVRTLWVMCRGDKRNESVIAAAVADKQACGEAKDGVLEKVRLPSQSIAAGEERPLLAFGGGS